MAKKINLTLDYGEQSHLLAGLAAQLKEGLPLNAFKQIVSLMDKILLEIYRSNPKIMKKQHPFNTYVKKSGFNLEIYFGSSPTLS